MDTTYLALPHASEQRVALHCIAPVKPTGRGVLFIHGSSFPTTLAAGFEFAPGDSWMHFMAERGFLACGLDFLGFGGSSRPPAMLGAAGRAPPVLRAQDAAADIALAVAHMRSVRGVHELHIVAHSWGTIPAATYASQHASTLKSLMPLFERQERAFRAAKSMVYENVHLPMLWERLQETSNNPSYSSSRPAPG